jgi:hypothetical protein
MQIRHEIIKVDDQEKTLSFARAIPPAEHSGIRRLQRFQPLLPTGQRSSRKSNPILGDITNRSSNTTNHHQGEIIDRFCGLEEIPQGALARLNRSFSTW